MTTGRQTHLQVQHHLRGAFTFSNAGASVKIGTIPKGARVISAHVIVETAFNAATTNTLNLGYSANGTDLLNAQTLASTAFVAATMTMANSTAAASADKDVFAQYNQTGNGQSTGVATVIVTYAPDNS